MRRRSGFTLIELLVVIFIILLLSVVALPTVLPALNHRQVSEAARILQGALVGARDKAIHDGQPSGIRLLPDPAFPIGYGSTTTNTINPYSILAYNRIVPIGPAPDYNEGFCTPTFANAVYTGGATLTSPATLPTPSALGLLLIENPVDPKSLAPNPPTSWFWNIRVGDRIQLNNAGPWYTIVGPMGIGPQGQTLGGTFYSNTEMFVNAGPPTSLASLSSSGLVPTLTYPGGTSFPVEYLILVNGQDDNNNGWVDEGADGVDNDGDYPTYPLDENNCKIAPNVGEWEPETWLGAVLNGSLNNVPYTIQRRPAPAPNAREIALPTSMVIDATSILLNNKERSRLPVNLQTSCSGIIDIVVNPDGTVLPTTAYSSPSSIGIDQAFYHFWLAERQDLNAVQTNANGPVTWSGNTVGYYLPIAQPGGSNASNFPGPYLKGEYSVVTLNSRTGQISTNANPTFFYDPSLGYTNQPGSSAVYNSVYPFIQAEQGVNGGP
jgi:prepilin-type N-terminal cleavage/methylation domain-containing protein